MRHSFGGEFSIGEVIGYGLYEEDFRNVMTNRDWPVNSL